MNFADEGEKSGRMGFFGLIKDQKRIAALLSECPNCNRFGRWSGATRLQNGRLYFEMFCRGCHEEYLEHDIEWENALTALTVKHA